MWWLLPMWVAKASVVDRVVAVVETQVVLASDVRLDEELAPHDPSPIPFWTQGAAADRQLSAAILRSAAGDIALYQPSAESVRKRLDALRGGFESRDAWETFLVRWGMDETALLAVLNRRMVVELYLQRNVQVPLTDRSAWQTEAKRLTEELRARVRVREVHAVTP